jgi:hypothetical protein
MKYIFTTLFFFASFLSALPAHACRCFPIRSFCESIRPENPVLLGVVTRHYASAGANLMDVKVLEWLKSPGFPISDITIVGGDGGDCLIRTEDFMSGDTLILTPVLFFLSPEINAEHITFGLFGGCAVPFLRVNNGVVQGVIREGLNSVHLSSLVSELGMCIDDVVLNDIKLFPNPVGSRFQLWLSGAFLPEQVRFYNVLGQEVVLNSSIDETKSRLTVDAESLSAGVYFAVLQYGSYRRTFKWVKS